MGRTLTDFLNSHRGETAWLFGKGPSLDTFLALPANADWVAGKSPFPGAGKDEPAIAQRATAGKCPVLCAINDVAEYVPGCRYAFANDSVAKWAHIYQPGQVLFQPLRLQHDMHAAKCETAAERVWYADATDDERLLWPIEQAAAEGLAVRRGTLGSAAQILRLMGVTKIVCVGIDGGGQHANRPWHTRLRADHAKDYDSIRDDFITACRLSGLDYEFYGLPASQIHGTMHIKITDNCLVEGIHRPAGSIVELNESLARQMIGLGRATIWTPPAKAQPVIETAEAPPAAETAEEPKPEPKAKKAKK